MNYEPLYTFAEKHRVPYNELCTALREALAAPQPEPWMPIESAPRDGSGVLLFFPCRGVMRGNWKTEKYNKTPKPYWTHDLESIFGVRETRADQPTHWMPLPAAPGAAPPAAPIDGFGGNLDEAFDAPAAPADMVMAPKEPTHEMLYAMAELDGWRKGDRDHPMFTRWRDYWYVALAAAPAPAVPAGRLRLECKPCGDAWLHMDAPSGNKASINLGQYGAALAVTTIVGRVVQEIAASSAAPAVREPQPLVEIRRRATPCGECHLQPGERCDICGACTIEQARGIGGGGK